MSEETKCKFSNYLTLLEEIRKRPQMYLAGDERNLQSLVTFLDGFRIAEIFHKVPVQNQMGDFDWESYEKWVKDNYNRKGLSLNSMPLAVHICDSKSEAFDLWFSWYDLFCKTNNE